MRIKKSKMPIVIRMYNISIINFVTYIASN